MRPDSRLPVTQLTRFLGAGKTTLLNAVLRDGSNGKVAVIVNEFGDAGLDHDLIEGIVHIEGLGTPFVFRGVQHVFDPPVPMTDWSDGKRRSRIVVIARDLARPELQRSLNMLRACALGKALILRGVNSLIEQRLGRQPRNWRRQHG